MLKKSSQRGFPESVGPRKNRKTSPNAHPHTTTVRVSEYLSETFPQFLSNGISFSLSSYLFPPRRLCVCPTGASEAGLLSLQMRPAAGIFFATRLGREGEGGKVFIRGSTFIGHGADLHSEVQHPSDHQTLNSSKQAKGEVERKKKQKTIKVMSKETESSAPT